MGAIHRRSLDAPLDRFEAGRALRLAQDAPSAAPVYSVTAHPIRTVGVAKEEQPRGRECPTGRDPNGEYVGAPGRNRTCDPWLRRPMLYPTELRAPWSAEELSVPSLPRPPEAINLRGESMPGFHYASRPLPAQDYRTSRMVASTLDTSVFASPAPVIQAYNPVAKDGQAAQNARQPRS